MSEHIDTLGRRVTTQEYPPAPIELDRSNRSWSDSALCAQTDQETFFPEKGGSTREAKKVCKACPVTAECLAYAIANGERFGIWGGLSERERRKMSDAPKVRRRTSYTGPCLGCGRPMRSCNTPAADAPGTVQHAAKGQCAMCYARAGKAIA